MKGIRGPIGILILLLIVAGALWAMGLIGSPFGRSTTDYQAVFLANGQVYFGKFRASFGTPVLTDIYYLRVQQPIQPKGEEEKPDIKVVKLGNEIHGPKDMMRFNGDQILFVEDLKEDGKVVTAIRAFQSGEQPQ